MEPTFAIAQMAFRRLWHKKLLIGTLIAALAILVFMSTSLTFMSMALQSGGSGESWITSDVIVGLTLYFQSLFIHLVALISGVTVIQQEVREGTISNVLARPISSWQYILGVFVGSGAYMLWTWTVFLCFDLCVWYFTGRRLSGSHGVMLLGLLSQNILMLSISLCASQRFATAPAVAVSLIVYNGGEIVQKCLGPGSVLNSSASEWLTPLLVFLFPATSETVKAFPSLARVVRLGSTGVGMSFLHLIDYSALMVILACWLFGRKEFTQRIE